MGKFIDLTGQKFEKLTVLKRVENNTWGNAKFLCECECGNKIKAAANNLKKGNTKSCGCLKKSLVTTHGMMKSPEYHIWADMKARCHNRNCKSFKNYGKRGITVCRRWRNSFENFYSDMGPRPSDTHSIDRIDNDGHYSPKNCRWATRTEQARNMRSNRLLTYQGKTKTVAEWAEIKGMTYDALRSRIRLGWSVEKALNTPVKTKRSK